MRKNISEERAEIERALKKRNQLSLGPAICYLCAPSRSAQLPGIEM